MDLEDILTCCICLDTVVAPKTLPCQHTFCKEPCLQSLIQNESVLCPMCRNTFAVPVNGFPTNYVMEQLLHLKQPQNQRNEHSLPQNQANEPDLTGFFIVPNQTLISASMAASASINVATKDDALDWVKFNGFRIPNGAIIGGYTGHENLYIGRALNGKAMTPGTVVPSRNSLYLAWGVNTHITTEFEILVGTKYKWVRDSHGHVPDGAFIAGYTENGESIFIGRAMYGKKVLVGKIHPSNKLCYIPNMYERKVLEYQNYEVLVVQKEYVPIPIKVNETISWVKFNGYHTLNGAITGGIMDKEKLYIGRAVHGNALTPGSVIPSRNCLFIPWGPCTYIKTEFEVLVGGSKYNWVESNNGHVPDNAFVGGYTENGEPTFIGRVMHRNNLLVGKILPSSKRCYIPDVDTQKVLEFYEYEVFVVELSK